MVNSLGIILYFGPFLYFAYFATSQSATCDASTYGKPKQSDCTTLFKKFTESQVLQSRLFDEEQLRAEPDPDFSWPGIDNPFALPVVQMPKFYSMNTCNFAIMPYTNPLSRLSFPLGISSWGSIKKAGLLLITECLQKKGSSGGEIFVKDTTSEDPVLVIFMWASAANFEAKLNSYENDPTFSVQLSSSLVRELGVSSINGTHIDAQASSKNATRQYNEVSLPSNSGSDGVIDSSS